jgi:hypothetical protein
MTLQHAGMTAWEYAPARLIAPAVDKLPIVRCLDPHLVAMNSALEREVIPNPTGRTNQCDLLVLEVLVMSPENPHHTLPRPTLNSKHFGVAEDVEAPLRARQSHANAIVNREKSNIAILVASDERKYYNVILFTLIGVDSCHFEGSAAKILM